MQSSIIKLQIFQPLFFLPFLLKTDYYMKIFKTTDKHNISVGQHFESCKELSTYTNKSNKTISTWKNKGWIKQKKGK